MPALMSAAMGRLLSTVPERRHAGAGEQRGLGQNRTVRGIAEQDSAGSAIDVRFASVTPNDAKGVGVGYATYMGNYAITNYAGGNLSTSNGVVFAGYYRP